MRSPLSAIIRYSEELRTSRVDNLTAEQRAGIVQINADAVELLELAVRRLDAVMQGPVADDPGGAQSPASAARPAPRG